MLALLVHKKSLENLKGRNERKISCKNAGWVGGWVSGWMDEWMDGWMVRQLFTQNITLLFN
jgi:hypothetical protein